MRSDFSHEEQVPLRNDSPRMRSRAPIWASVGLLAAATGGLYWYGVRDNESRLTELASIRTSLNTAGTQLNLLAEKFRNWDEQNFGGRLQKLESSVDIKFQSVLRAAQKQAQDSAQVIAARLRGEFDSRSQRIESRLATVERLNEQDRTQVASLQAELHRVKQELVQQQTRIDGATHNASADKQFLESKIAAVRGETEQGRRDLDNLARGIETRRIGFEISKGHSRDIAEGISIGVTGTDIAHRRVKGWMWIMPDRKTIWLRDQGALQPVVFYSDADGKRREVVFTHVTQNSAVGYVLLPSGTVARPVEVSTAATVQHEITAE
jgi:hypothetical protein